jgi:hypothetical protein
MIFSRTPFIPLREEAVPIHGIEIRLIHQPAGPVESERNLLCAGGVIGGTGNGESGGLFGLVQALLRGDLGIRYLIFIHVLSSILWQLKRRVVFSNVFRF